MSPRNTRKQSKWNPRRNTWKNSSSRSNFWTSSLKKTPQRIRGIPIPEEVPEAAPAKTQEEIPGEILEEVWKEIPEGVLEDIYNNSKKMLQRIPGKSLEEPPQNSRKNSYWKYFCGGIAKGVHREILQGTAIPLRIPKEFLEKFLEDTKINYLYE